MGHHTASTGKLSSLTCFLEVGQDSFALRGPQEYVENIIELAGSSLMMILVRSFCPETTCTGPNFRLGVVNSSDLQK